MLCFFLQLFFFAGKNFYHQKLGNPSNLAYVSTSIELSTPRELRKNIKLQLIHWTLDPESLNKARVSSLKPATCHQERTHSETKEVRLFLFAVLICAPGGVQQQVVTVRKASSQNKGCQWEIRSFHPVANVTSILAVSGVFIFFRSLVVMIFQPWLSLAKRISMAQTNTRWNIHNCQVMPTGNWVPVCPPPKPLG